MCGLLSTCDEMTKKFYNKTNYQVDQIPIGYYCSLTYRKHYNLIHVVLKSISKMKTVFINQQVSSSVNLSKTSSTMFRYSISMLT